MPKKIGLSCQSTGMSRRMMISTAGGGLAAAATFRASESAAEQAPCVSPVKETVYGRIRGLVRAGVEEFKGIPYGAPTGGRNRFLPPRRPKSWTGVREALTYGAPCPQFNPWGAFFVDAQPASEDCLALNVWAPAVRDKKEMLPVMVWIHGGGFESESGGVPAYAGDQLAKNGHVVVVSLNHRLNIFGYSYLAEGTDERFSTSGNVGQLDLIAALQWVRDNITNFGGDPDNVTIFGESGGGGKVNTAIAMPAMKGLFHKAIVQSGPYLKSLEPAEAAEMTARACAYLGVKGGDIEALQELPIIKLLEAYRHVRAATGAGGNAWYGPVVDGHVLFRHPWAPDAPTYSTKIPMMIGTTHEEEALFLAGALGEAIADSDLAAKIAENVRFIDHSSERYQPLIERYRSEMPGLSNVELLVRITTDAGWWRPALLQAERKIAVGGPPVFMYEFGWKVPYQGGAWAIHGTDLPFMLGHPDYAPGWGPDDSQPLREAADPEGDRYRVAEQAMKAWAAFARTGNPSTDELKWPAYDLNNRTTMIFDRDCRLEDDPRGFARKAITAL